MLYICLLLYIAAVYVRPSEIVTALVTVPTVDILAAFTVLVALVTLLLRPRRIVPTPADLCVLGFWGTIVLSNASWGWFGGAWQGFLDFLPVVFCYFLVRIAVTTPRQLTGLVNLLIALNLFLAINGIVQYHTGIGLGGVEAITDEQRIRGTGIFNDPNDLGMTLVMTAALVLPSLFRAGESARGRVMWSVALAILIVAIYYTNSRGAIVGLGAVIAVLSFRRFGTISGTLATATAVSLLLMLGPSRVGAIDASEASAQTRVEAWGEGLQMLKANPFLGVGYGRFTEYHYKVAHNSIVHALSELGLVGATFLIGCFYAFFHSLSILRRRGSKPDDAHQAWALSVCAVGAIACCYFLSRQYVVVPFLLVAMGVVRATVVEQRTDAYWKDTVLHSTGVLAVTAGSVIVVWVSVRLLGAW